MGKQRNKPGVSFYILLLDLGLSMVSSLIAVLTVRWLSDPFGSLKHFVYIWVMLSSFSSIAGFLLFGTNRIMIFHSSYRSIAKLVKATFVKELILCGCTFSGLFQLSSFNINMLVILMDTLVTVFVLVTVRVFIIFVNDSMKSSPEEQVDKTHILVYGTTDKSAAIRTRLKNSTHYNVLGFVTSDMSKKDLIIQDLKVYAYDSPEKLRDIIQKVGAGCILFTKDDEFEEDMGKIVNVCMEMGVHILISPTIGEAPVLKIDETEEIVNPKPKEQFIPDGMSGFERTVKRVADMLASGVCIIVFLPLFFICWLAIKLDDGGPAIYKQERIGRFGRPFYIYKFRSMRVNAEATGPSLYSGDNDPRLTKVGAFLRAHHLDELPQLWNVFCGEMAFVGPRPERKYYIDQIMEYDKRYAYLYQIRPGVTSYATFYNGYTDTMEKMLKRLEYDLYYLRHRSWALDVKVLGMTFLSIIFGKKF